MEAQRVSVASYAAQNAATIIASYAEVETAKRDHLKNRPELVRALAHARRCGALLVIARLDRLSRSVFVTAQLMQSGVEFVACDNPHANPMTIQILAVMAEHESRMISARVKAAMAAARSRGVVFECNRKLTAEQMRLGQLASGAASRARAPGVRGPRTYRARTSRGWDDHPIHHRPTQRLGSSNAKRRLMETRGGLPFSYTRGSGTSDVDTAATSSSSARHSTYRNAHRRYQSDYTSQGGLSTSGASSSQAVRCWNVAKRDRA